MLRPTALLTALAAVSALLPTSFARPMDQQCQGGILTITVTVTAGQAEASQTQSLEDAATAASSVIMASSAVAGSSAGVGSSAVAGSSAVGASSAAQQPMSSNAASAIPVGTAEPTASQIITTSTTAAAAVSSAGQTGPYPTAPGLPPVSQFWMESIKRQGQPAFGSSGWQVYRNVRDFGAKGDGSTDDTAAINSAITAGGRCGQGCDSQTTTPAIVYFPAGTYLVSKPLVQLYYTQFIGDPFNPPTLKAAASFQGMAVIDSDPYDNSGNNWYVNQNNFYRQVRNFVIDLTAMPANIGAGIHWQVAQATSLQNIRFEMVQGGSNNKQLGIFMDNGSGGFMTDLIFNGGQYGAFLGSQQFTTRNLTFNNCQTAIFMNWNWLWNLKSINVNNCGTAVDMSNGGTNQTVGSVVLIDSKITNTPIGVATGYGNAPATGGTLILDNVDFENCAAAVTANKNTVLAGNQVVGHWAQGKEYGTSKAGSQIQGSLTVAAKPASLLDSNGKIFERSRPQYEAWPTSLFISVKDQGAKGDGSTDDTAAVQATINKAASTQNGIAYFDHGAYVITNTVTVPKNVRITGEMWPIIMASGSNFADETSPKAVFQVGQPGDAGIVEMSDLVFETKGSVPGAVLVEWNIRDPEGMPGVAGMWDVHWRIGGTAGTGLQSNTCAKNPSTPYSGSTSCEAAGLLLHVTKSASIYMENNWLWVADHELDLSDHGQIDIYNARGMLVEAQQGPVWLYGSAVEHNQLYNYEFNNARNVYMGHVQTETPYYQNNPGPTKPFKSQSVLADPDFSQATSNDKAWGMRIISSQDILMYGGGFYSFFDNYWQTCIATESCQDNMVSIEGNNSNVYLYGLSTKASTNMVTYPGGTVPQADNRDNFCSTIALFEAE